MKELNLPCSCAGGKQTCGFLRIINLKGQMEFCWVKTKEQKRAKTGIVLSGKDLEKLKNFIK